MKKIKLKTKSKSNEKKAKKYEKSYIDIIKEDKVTDYCPESIKKDEMEKVLKNPEYYLEVNLLQKTRFIDTFYVKLDSKSFHYRKKKYSIKDKCIFFVPNDMERFTPTIFYYEGKVNPKAFKRNNKGITGKALSLLYMKQLYAKLLYDEEIKYNFFIVLLSIFTLIAFAVGVYLFFVHGGGGEPTVVEEQVPSLQAIINFRWWF